MNLLDTFEGDHTASLSRVADLRKIHDALAADNYHKIEVIFFCVTLHNTYKDVKSKMAEVDKLWADIQTQKEAKQAKAKEDFQREKEKEELRLDFALKAKEFKEWINASCDIINAPEFGSNLEDVIKIKEVLDQEDNRYLKEAEDKKNTIAATVAKMEQFAIIDNAHTTITKEDIQTFFSQLADALKERQAKYEKELARQQAMEAKRLEFAAAADNLAEFLKAEVAAIDTMNGEPDPLTEEIKARFGEGARADELLKKAQEIYADGLRIEVTENKVSSLIYHSSNLLACQVFCAEPCQASQ